VEKRVAEADNENEVPLGIDFIGIDAGGSIHTFHCYDKGTALDDRLGPLLNGYGLFDNSKNAKEVLDYLNDGTNRFEFGPWFSATTKFVINC
jgi:hypothetical protein